MNANCQHQRAYTYLDQTEDGPVFIVRKCHDCHAEIVRHEMSEQKIVEIAKAIIQRDVDRDGEFLLLVNK